MAQYILGSGEKTVAPTSGLPSFSFCLAVLYSGFCCAICAFPTVRQKNARQMAQNAMIDFARKVSSSGGNAKFDRQKKRFSRAQ